jgi:hypothetical protein
MLGKKSHKHQSLNTRQSRIHFMIVLYMSEETFIGPQFSYFIWNVYFTPNSNIYIPFVLQRRSCHFALLQSSFFYLAIIVLGNLVFWLSWFLLCLYLSSLISEVEFLLAKPNFCLRSGIDFFYILISPSFRRSQIFPYKVKMLPSLPFFLQTDIVTEF